LKFKLLTFFVLSSILLILDFRNWFILLQAIKDLPDAQVTDKSRKVDGCVTKFRPWWRRRGRNRF